MAWKKYNPNPESKRVGDCTVRALCKVLDKDWETVFVGLCVTGLELGDMPSGNSVWGEYLWERGFRRRLVPADCPSCYTVRDFCEAFPEGRYILALDKHVIAIVDGDYYDTFDSGDEVPIFYWVKEI